MHRIFTFIGEANIMPIISVAFLLSPRKVADGITIGSDLDRFVQEVDAFPDFDVLNYSPVVAEHEPTRVDVQATGMLQEEAAKRAPPFKYTGPIEEVEGPVRLKVWLFVTDTRGNTESRQSLRSTTRMASSRKDHTSGARRVWIKLYPCCAQWACPARESTAR